jgi:flagellar protein FlgJ
MIPGLMAVTLGSTAVSAGGGSGAAIDPRLKPAAHQFEACMMKEFLEPLQKGGLFSEEEAGSEGSGNALMSFGSEALANAISERGGFGIAKKVIGELGRGQQAHGAGHS